MSPGGLTRTHIHTHMHTNILLALGREDRHGLKPGDSCLLSNSVLFAFRGTEILGNTHLIPAVNCFAVRHFEEWNG